MLSVARSLGDYDPDTGAKVLGVSGEAEVSELVLDDTHEFLIVRLCRRASSHAHAHACARTHTHARTWTSPVPRCGGINLPLGVRAACPCGSTPV